MAQLMPLPLTVSCFTKIQIGFTFLVPAHLCSPGKSATERMCIFEQPVSTIQIQGSAHSKTNSSLPDLSDLGLQT